MYEQEGVISQYNDNEEETEEEFTDFELLDELTTNRGEVIKIRTMSFHSERWTPNGACQSTLPRPMSMRHDKHFKVPNIYRPIDLLNL